MFLDSPLFYGAGRFKLHSKSVYSDKSLDADLDRLGDAWSDLQKNRDRDAIYSYLTPVFEVVAWWNADGQSAQRARRALGRRGIKAPNVIEPFAAVISATTHPTTLDKRLVSKWSRALRYVAAAKRTREPLDEFIKRQGGINACATGYSRRFGRRSSQRDSRR